MKTKMLMLTVGVFLAVGLRRPAQAAYVERIGENFSANWIAQSLSDREYDWHNQCGAVGGLGYDVALDVAPRLVQRTWPDVFNFMNGARRLYNDACYMEFGMIRGSSTGTPSLTDSCWTYKKYSSGSLTYYVSRLSPAVLVETDDTQLDLFAGTKYVGTYTDAPTSWIMPSYVAYKSSSGVTVADATTTVSLSGMQESWLLIWWGTDTNFRKTTMPNVFSRVETWDDYYTDGDLMVEADSPVLVVFQNKPTQISPVSDALRISFDQDGADSVCVMPAYGWRHVKSSITEGWATSFPSAVQTLCSTWAKRLKKFPLKCKEEAEVVNDGATVRIRHTYTYLDLPDEWSTTAEQIAPIAPAVRLAQAYGASITLSGTPASNPVTTHSGPYTGVVDTNTVTYTLSDLDTYIDETVVSPSASGDDAEALADEINSEVQKMIDAGSLNAAMSLEKKHPEKIWWHFISAAETLWAVSDAYPYLESSRQSAIITYAESELSGSNPLTSTLPKFSSSKARREYYEDNFIDLDTVEAIIDYNSRRSFENALPRVGVRTEDQGNSAYAFWAYGNATSRWSVVQNHWSTIKTKALSGTSYAEWASCGYFGLNTDNTAGSMPIGGENRGSIYSSNGQFARFVALTRLARQFSDSTTEEQAIYLLARTALLRLAQGKMIRYLYDSDIITIDEDSDWMYTYSTAHGEGGPGLLWTDDWTDYQDDHRTVLLWDERGPIIADMVGDNWDPVQIPYLLMSPELGRFLSDRLSNETALYANRVELNCPAWFMVRRPSNVGKESSMDNPINSFGMYMAKVYALDAEGSDVLKYTDVPFVKVGDLYHIRRLTAALRSLNGLNWQ